MRKSGGNGKKKQPDAIDEVEELLRLTQEDLLLNLTVNSHTRSKPKSDFIPESSNSIAIDPDLDRRFQALRSKPKPKPKPNVAQQDVDDLFARFAALKAPDATAASTSESGDVKHDSCDGEEDEVQKIINWAVDAARLDPSPSSVADDDDDSYSDDDDDDDSYSDDDSDDDEGVARKKKG